MANAQSKKLGFWAGVGMGALGIGAALSATYAVRQMRRFDFHNKVILISGGSRGLALEMARILLREGGIVALAARDTEELNRAREILAASADRVFTFTCDVTKEDEVKKVVAAVEQQCGKIDVLINNAGLIQAGPMESQSKEDYERTMNTHFWAPLYMTLAVLPTMKERSSGRIVNIASIAGLISVPHLLPYCASKHALVGLSQGLRTELLQDNILVTTVCPGLMRTGSHINAEFKGHNKAEYAMFSIMDGLPISSINAADAANEIVNACRYGDANLVISVQAQFAKAMHDVAPSFVSDTFGIINAVLPKGSEDNQQTYTGRESQSAFAPSIATKLADDASKRNNE